MIQVAGILRASQGRIVRRPNFGNWFGGFFLQLVTAVLGPLRRFAATQRYVWNWGRGRHAKAIAQATRLASERTPVAIAVRLPNK